MTSHKAKLKISDNQVLKIEIVLSLEESDLIKREIKKKAIEDVSLFSRAWGHKSFNISYDSLSDETEL